MGITTREIATDHAVATTAVQLENAAVFAVSQGGMIAQFLTIDHPELVSKLVLAVTTPEADETLKSVVSSWPRPGRVSSTP
jgi:pimeloyl-ACP methyl ester carboxylesterase